MRPDNGKKEKVFSFSSFLLSWGFALQKPTVPTYTGTKGGDTLQTRKAFPAANSHFPPRRRKTLFLEFGLCPGDPTPTPHIPRQRKIRAHKKDTKKKSLLPFQDLRRPPRTRLFRPTPSPSPASTWARGRRRRCSPTRSGTCRWGKTPIAHMLFVCLFVDGPISGPPSCTQNAGAERRCGIQLPRGPVWLDSAVQLDASLPLGVAVSWEMKVVPRFFLP